MSFVDRHFGDFVALFLICLGAGLMIACGAKNEVCTRLGDALTGAGLVALRLKAPSGNGDNKQ